MEGIEESEGKKERRKEVMEASDGSKEMMGGKKWKELKEVRGRMKEGRK